VVRRVQPSEQALDSSESIIDKLMGRVRKKKIKAGVLVKGLDDILIRFGKCCQPVPGDPIIGYITRGFGVTVHRTHCVNALKLSPERQIDCEWNMSVSETYPVKLRILSHDRVGLLADMVGSISKYGANILNARTETRNSTIVESYFTIGVEDTDHLDKIVSAIKKVRRVQDVKRIG
jgi:GTP pyrophosphokinase